MAANGSIGFAWDDPYAFIDQSVSVEDSGGLRCEMKVYEARYNSQGERMILQVGIKNELNPKKDRNHDSALVVTRYYKRDTELEYTELEVRSPYLKTALRTVIPEYPGVNLHTTRIVMRDLPKCLFHYRRELQEYGATLEDPLAVEHLLFGLRYMYQTLQTPIRSYYNLMESPSLAPGIEFENLWMAFRPGSLVYSKTDNIEIITRVNSMFRCDCMVPHCWRSKWTMKVDYINYDGDNFGVTASYRYSIQPYDGYRPLQKLNIFPLKYHPEKEAVVERIIARGRRFIGLMKTHHQWYEGVTDSLSTDRRQTALYGEEDEFPIQSIMVKGRVVIDCKKFSQLFPSHKVEFDYGARMINTESGDHLNLSDEDLLMCHHTVVGFSLNKKKWCYFEIDRLTDIDFNTKAFDSLLLPRDQKEMIHSLVKVHADTKLQFNDLIKGKGMGMVFLLHGAPGVGKTLTAESVADYTKRPLYTISSGDLGVKAESVERELVSALELATNWNAIVLIDEADVFLEQRSTHDLERNGLVSVFLRLLEYYEGIMFLTTNRIGTFDEAFKSRIHLAIKYPSLTASSRRDLWKTFITNGLSDRQIPWLDDTILDKLAAQEINGRQIKNIVRTAYALAASTEVELSPKHLAMGIKAIKAFEAEFEEIFGGPVSQNRESSGSERGEKRQRLV